MVAGRKYKLSDIKSGRRVFANGAIAGYVDKEKTKFRIITPPVSRTAKPRSAKRAMSKYYNDRLEKGVYKTQRSMRTAVERDICGSNKPTVDIEQYKKNPSAFDFAGLDDGAKCKGTVTPKRVPSKKQLAALARGRSKRRSNLKK